MAQGIVNAPGNVLSKAKEYTDAEAEARAEEDKTLQNAVETVKNTIDTHITNDSPTDDTTSTSSPSHGGTVTMVDGVTRDDAGHVLSVNTKTVTLPSDNNTDTKVTQTNTTTSTSYRLLLSGTASDSSLTETARKSTNFKANPSTGVLTAPTFSGNLTGNVTGDVTGNADTATTATKLGSSDVGDANTPIYISGGTAMAGNNIKNYATYVVAAINSVGRENADYVCDGTNDEEEIRAAIHAITTASMESKKNGKVVLLAGTYYISSSISLGSSYSNITIEGMTSSGHILWNMGHETAGPKLKFADGVDSLFTANNYIHVIFKNINFVGTVEHGIVSMGDGEVTFENCSARISVTGEEATAIVEGSSVNLPSTAVVSGSVVNFLGANYFLITYEDTLDICAAMLRTVYVNGGGCFIDCIINGSHDNSVFYNCRGEFHDSTILGADTICSQTPLNIHDCYMDCMRPSQHYVYSYGSFCNNRIVINDGSSGSDLYMSAAQISGNRINCYALKKDLTIYARMFNGNMLYDNNSYPPILYNTYMSVIGNQWRYEPTIIASTSVSSGNLQYTGMSINITN